MGRTKWDRMGHVHRLIRRDELNSIENPTPDERKAIDEELIEIEVCELRRFNMIRRILTGIQFD